MSRGEIFAIWENHTESKCFYSHGKYFLSNRSSKEKPQILLIAIKIQFSSSLHEIFDSPPSSQLFFSHNVKYNTG
jgi:hypothetical protein